MYKGPGSTRLPCHSMFTLPAIRARRFGMTNFTRSFIFLSPPKADFFGVLGLTDKFSFQYDRQRGLAESRRDNFFTSPLFCVPSPGRERFSIKTGVLLACGYDSTLVA